MTVQHLSHPKYRPDIDGLRAVAVVAVVAFHAFPSWMKGGFIGVDVFFVISGYLISTIIFESLDKGTFKFTEFYARRIKRIFPALILVLVACLAFGWFTLLADEYKQLGKHIAAGAVFVSNLLLLNEVGYFDNAAHTKPLLHLWSLGIEEQFYIVWPFLLWFSWKRKFNLLIIIILVASASFMLNLKDIKHDSIVTFYSPLTRFWELLSGSLLSWLTLYKMNAFTNIKNNIDDFLISIMFREKQEANSNILSNILSLAGLLLLIYGFWRINKDLSFPGTWALVPISGAVLIITAGSKALVNRTILSNKVVVWFGLISFPLYLWHWPILSFFRILEGEILNRDKRIAAVLLSILFAWLTYKLIEKPIRWGSSKKMITVTLVTLLFTVGLAGGVIDIKKGYSSRYTDGAPPVPWEGIKCHTKDSMSKYENPLNECLGTYSNNKAGDIYLLGDSHAAQLTFPLRKVAGELGGDFYFMNTHDNNDVFLSMLLKGDVSGDSIINHLLNTVDKGDFLVITFHRGRLNDNRDQQIKLDETIDINQKEMNFYSSFNSIKDLFLKKGVWVVLINDGPLLNEGVNVQLCVLNNPIRKSLGVCELKYENDNHTRTRQNRVYDRLVAENKGKIIAIDPLPSLYKGGDTFIPYDFKSQKYYMFDRHHLTEFGSMMTYDFFKEEFLRLHLRGSFLR